MKNKQISVCTLVIIICIVVIGTFGITYSFIHCTEKTVAVENNNEVIRMDYGDAFTELKVKDAAGKVLNHFPSQQKAQIVVYLSDTCKTCINILKNMNCVEKVLGTQKVSYMILWKDQIPEKLVNQYDVDLNSCYSLENTELATSTPTIYLLDSDGKVSFSNIDFQLVIEKIIEMDLIPKKNLLENANEYVKSNFLKKNSDKVQILYFAMEGCPDCEKADKIVSQRQITDKFDVNRLYRFDDEKEEVLKDVYGVFRQVYGIQWYPSFVIFKNNGIKIIGETPESKLEAEILKQLN